MLNRLTGVHRCQTVDIVVVSDLSVLHDVVRIAAGDDLAVSFVYIVLRGLDVATQHQWQGALEAGASGRVSRMFHVEIRRECNAFSFGEQLCIEHPDVVRAFRRVAGLADSKLSIEDDADSSDVHFQTLSEVVAWASSARRIRNSLGCKVVSVDGVSRLA